MEAEKPKETDSANVDEMIRAAFEAGVRAGAGSMALFALAVFAFVFLVRTTTGQ